MTIQMSPMVYQFPVVQFVASNKLSLTVKSVDEILRYDYSDESY